MNRALQHASVGCFRLLPVCVVCGVWCVMNGVGERAYVRAESNIMTMKGNKAKSYISPPSGRGYLAMSHSHSNACNIHPTSLVKTNIHPTSL